MARDVGIGGVISTTRTTRRKAARRCKRSIRWSREPPDYISDAVSLSGRRRKNRAPVKFAPCQVDATKSREKARGWLSLGCQTRDRLRDPHKINRPVGRAPRQYQGTRVPSWRSGGPYSFADEPTVPHQD